MIGHICSRTYFYIFINILTSIIITYLPIYFRLNIVPNKYIVCNILSTHTSFDVLDNTMNIFYILSYGLSLTY